ncbi:MAG: hypothetical protein ACI8T1_002808 [Verrucomicrobiales bacterium]|jgi:hypothetical protein
MISRRALKAYAWIVTLIVLFYAVENWRGARAYIKAQQEYEASGGTLALKDLMPSSVPDEDNFFTTPVMRTEVR